MSTSSGWSAFNAVALSPDKRGRKEILWTTSSAALIRSLPTPGQGGMLGSRAASGPRSALIGRLKNRMDSQVRGHGNRTRHLRPAGLRLPGIRRRGTPDRNREQHGLRHQHAGSHALRGQPKVRTRGYGGGRAPSCSPRRGTGQDRVARLLAEHRCLRRRAGPVHAQREGRRRGMAGFPRLRRRGAASAAG